MTDRLKEAARYWTECKEQATRREWSDYGNIRMEAFKAGARWALEEAARVAEWEHQLLLGHKIRALADDGGKE